MLGKVINMSISPLGLEVRRTGKIAQLTPAQPKTVVKEEHKPTDFSLYSYVDSKGRFDYAAYKRVQEEGNKRKLDQIWAREENIAYLSDYLKKKQGKVSFGLCHGTRRGAEQVWFRKYLKGADVIGTEISKTATQFPYTIQWDFHKVKPAWKNKADFVYSNSFDHSYDPEKCLNAWISSLKPGGICIIEHSDADHSSRELDPFGAHLVQMPYLITLWGQGRYGVREILPAPKVKDELKYIAFIVIEKYANKPIEIARAKGFNLST